MCWDGPHKRPVLRWQGARNPTRRWIGDLNTAAACATSTATARQRREEADRIVAVDVRARQVDESEALEGRGETCLLREQWPAHRKHG